MMRGKKFLILTFAMLLCTGIGLAQYQVGDTVANFTESDADGNSVSLYDFMNHVVMVTIWANW